MPEGGRERFALKHSRLVECIPLGIIYKAELGTNQVFKALEVNTLCQRYYNALRLTHF